MSESNATLAVAKRRGGRKPASESRRIEDRDAIIAWKLTPEHKRQPATLTALAHERGISKSQASYWAKQAPDSVDALIDESEREGLLHYPRVLKVLLEMAEGGNIEAIKVVLRDIVGPRRPQAKGFDFQADARFQALIALGPPPRLEWIAAHPEYVASAPALPEPPPQAESAPPEPPVAALSNGNGDAARPCEPKNILTGRHDQWCHCRDCRPDLPPTTRMALSP